MEEQQANATASERDEAPRADGAPVPPGQQPAGGPIEDISAFPALAQWKTSIGFSILGIVLPQIVYGFAFMPAVTFLNLYTYDLLTWVALSSYVSVLWALVYGVLTLLYAIIFYPSYFTEKPRVRSSKAISLLNFCFGGIVFGAIWNHNLTRSKEGGKPAKGVSYIVAIVFASLSILSCLSTVFLTIVPNVNYAHMHYATTSAPYQDFDADEEETYEDPEHSVTFSVPDGWEVIDMPSDSEFVFAIEPVVDSGFSWSYIDVFTVDDVQSEMIFDLTLDDFMEDLAPEEIVDWRSTSLESTTINGLKYNVFSGYGKEQTAAGQLDVYYSCYQTVFDDRLFVFELYDYEEPVNGQPALLSDFKQFVRFAEFKGPDGTAGAPGATA